MPRASEAAAGGVTAAERAGDDIAERAGQGAGRKQAAAKSAAPGAPPPGRIVPASFFARPSDEVACDLIGKIVWARGAAAGRLTEVEAYLPEGDPACHAYRGPTRRNAAMFGPPGSIYIFRCYGIHLLLNFVCEQEGVGSAVLVRSFEPLESPGVGARTRGYLGNAWHSASCATQACLVTTSGLSAPGLVGRALQLRLELNGLPLGMSPVCTSSTTGISRRCRSPRASASARGSTFSLGTI